MNDESEVFTEQLQAARIAQMADWVHVLPRVPASVTGIEMLVTYDDAGQIKVSVGLDRRDEYLHAGLQDEPAPPKPRTYWIASATMLGAVVLGTVIGFWLEQVL
jgi:hypothetical protein